MSKEAYIRGFCKVAEANSYDPFELARMAVGFNRLKKAEAKLFVKELRKKAGYTGSQPPVRLTAPNLRRQGSAQPQFEHYGRRQQVTPVKPVPTQLSKVNSQPNVTGNPPARAENPQYKAFADAAKKKGWNYSNGTWTSPNGQKFTDSQINSRMKLRSREKAINSRAAARRAAGIPVPQKTKVPHLNGVPLQSHGVDWGRKWGRNDLLNFDAKAFRRDADTWASRSLTNKTPGIGTFRMPGGSRRYW